MLCTFSTRTQPIIKAEKPLTMAVPPLPLSLLLLLAGITIVMCNNCSSISIRTCGEPIQQLVNQIQSNRCPTAECIDLVWGLQIGQWCSPDHTLHSFQVVMNLQRFQIRYCVNRSILSNNKAMWYNPLLWTAQALKTIRTCTT